MIRRVNRRALVIFLAVLVLSGVGLYYAHQYQVGRQAAVLLSQIDAAEKANEPHKAIEYLERYLLLLPGDALAWRRYANLLDSTAKGYSEKKQAFSTLEKALRLDTEGSAELRRKTAECAFALRLHREAKVQLEMLLKGAPDDLQLKQMSAQCEEALGNTDHAVRMYQEIINRWSDHLPSYIALSALYIEGRQIDKADQLLLAMLKAHPQSAEARLARCRFLQLQRKFAEATKELETARQYVRGEQGQADLLMASAELALDQGKPDQAAREFSQGMSQFPKDIRFYLGQGQLDLLRGDAGRPAALKTLHQALALNSPGAGDQFMLAKLLLDAGDDQSATRLYSTLRAKSGTTPALEYLRARLVLQEGKVGEGITLLEGLRDNLARARLIAMDAEYHLAEAYGQIGNREKQLEVVERVLKTSPAEPGFLLRKADLLVDMGRIVQARDIYSTILSQLPAARYRLARLLVDSERKKSAKERVWTEVKSLLDGCPEGEKHSREYLHTTFLVLWASEEFGQLEKSIQEACRIYPQESSFWLAKVAFLERKPFQDETARTAALDQCLRDAGKAVGDLVQLRLARARLLARVSGKELNELKQLQNDADRFNRADRLLLTIGLADIYRRRGLNSEAREILKQMSVLEPGNLGLLIRLIDLAIADKNELETQRLIALLREKEGEAGAFWVLADLSHMLTKARSGDKNALSRAKQLVADLSQRRRDWSRVVAAQGQILELERQPQLATARYLRAIEMGERDPEIIRKTVQDLISRRRLEDVRRLIIVHLGDLRDTPWYAKLESTVLLWTQASPADALRIAETVVRENPNAPEEHLWLGNFKWAAGDLQGAEASLKKAVEFGADDPEAWTTWLLFLLAQDRREEAARELKRSQATLKDRSPAVLIAYYEALEQRAQAEEQYLQLVEKNPGNVQLLQSLAMFYFRSSDSAKAEPYLKKLISDEKINAEMLTWARRTYALALAVKKEHQAYREALSLVEKNLKENPASAEDLRARALIQSTRPGQSKAIIKDLEESYAMVRPTPEEAVLLAQFYEENGQWLRAADTLQELVQTKEGERASVLSYYLIALVRNKDLDRAAPLLERLEAKWPGELVTMEAKVRYLFAREKAREAITFLESRSTQWLAQKKDPHILYSAGALLEEMGQPQAAEAFLKRFVTEASPSAPQAVLAMVGFLARQGRTSEALALCESIWSKLPEEAMAVEAVGVLHLGKPTEADFQRLEARLAAAAQAPNAKLGTRIALADLYGLQGRRSEAEALYRDILKQDSAQPVVLNNLAWMLSDRSETIEEAVQLINRAIELMGPEGALLDTRGMIYVRKQKYPDAIADLTEAVRQQPVSTRWMHLALAQFRAKNRGEAERAWNKARALGLDRAKLPQVERGWHDELSTGFSR